MSGSIIYFDDDWYLDTRCPDGNHGAQVHTAEYLHAFLYAAEHLGFKVDVDGPKPNSAVPLLRERFRMAMRIARKLRVPVNPQARNRAHYHAGTTFAEDSCAELAVHKKPQTAVRVVVTSLDRVLELHRFVKERGRFPREGSADPAERALAKWLASKRRRTDSTLRRYLDRYVPGWRFAGRDGTWRIKLSQVQFFVEEHGHAPSRYSTDADERKLGGWVHNQHTARRAKHRGENCGRALSDDQEQLLTELLPTLFEARSRIEAA